MANYELSNLQYKGNNYVIKDNSALHQSAIGSWTPDFANLKPLATYEFDITSEKNYYKICERANVTNITDLVDEVLAFRITVTGTNIFAVDDCIVRVQPTVNVVPRVTVNQQTRSTSAATTGIRYMRIVNPKAVNTSYKYVIEVATYNATARHIKVEVFKAPDAWTFFNAATTFSYNSTNQTATDLTLYTRIGLIGTSTHYMNTAYSDYAAYTSSWMSLFNSSNAVLVAGAAIAANQLAFVGEDYKVYPVTNTTQPILTAWPIMFVTTAIASGAACTWSYLRTWGYGAPATSVLRDTLAAHDTVYLKCTYMNGKVYSQNRITPTIGVGSNSTDTYYRLGVMYNTTALAFNTLGGVYFTVDMDGNMRAINGYSLNAENASVANAVKRRFYIANANDYPILFDSNPTSDIATATTIPSVTPALKYNPSTGNLTSGLFTGSGAGLTDIPVDELSDVVPLDKGGTGLDGGSDSWHASDILHPHFVISYTSMDGFFVRWNGPLDNIASVSDFLASDYFKYAQKETHPIFGDGDTFLGSAMLFTGAFDDPPDPTRLYFVFPDAVYFGGQFVNGFSCNLIYDAADGVWGNRSSMLPSVPKWAIELASKEDLSNKVTTVDGSSTDDQYPSAKAVYEAIPTKVDYSNTPFTGTCSTAASTTAKTVTVDSSFQLVDGVRVRVYMEKANTNSAPTLNVNGTGAKSIGIQGPYGAISNVALSAWHSGAFARNAWFDFVYVASYDGGKGRWIIEDSPAPIRLANFAASRLSTINSTNGTLVNGGVRYTVVANGVTGNPFGGSAAVLWLHHDSGFYCRQIAMSANTPPHMAFRSQDSGGGTTWQPWEYVLTAANQYDSHMATLAYTAAGIDFTTGAVTIPINGTQYKLIQLTIFNNDISKTLGYPSLFLFNASGSTGYKEGTSTYCTASSTSPSISVTFDSSWNMIGSTSIDITALYRRIS